MEKLWLPHSWKFSRPGWMGFGAACSAGKCPYPRQGGNGMSFKVLSKPNHSGFYDCEASLLYRRCCAAAGAPALVWCLVFIQTPHLLTPLPALRTFQFLNADEPDLPRKGNKKLHFQQDFQHSTKMIFPSRGKIQLLFKH